MSFKSTLRNTLGALTLSVLAGCSGRIYWGEEPYCTQSQIQKLNYEGQFVPLRVINSEQNNGNNLENKVEQMGNNEQNNDRINWYVVDK